MNVRSIRNKVPILNAYFNTFYKPDFVILTEIWLRKDELPLYIPSGYNLAAAYTRSPDNGVGGGVAVYCKLGIQLEVLELPAAADEVCECCAAFITIESVTSVVLGVYRNPQSDWKISLKHLEDCINLIHSKFGFHCNLFIAGDLNIDFLCSESDKIELFDMFNSYGLTLNYNEVTRLASGKGIDYLVCNKTLEDYSCNVDKCDISDHFAQVLHINKILLGFKSNSTEPNYEVKRIFSEANIAYFISLLKCQSWLSVYNNCDVNKKVSEFLIVFLKAFNEAFPKVKINLNANKNIPNIPPAVAAYSRFLKNWYAKCIKFNQPVPEQYVILKQRFNDNLVACEKAKNDYNIMTSKFVTKTTWQIVNRKIKRNFKQSCTKLLVDDVIITDPVKIANVFLDTFLAVPTPTPADPLPNHQPPTPQRMVLFPTDPATVSAAIGSLSDSRSAGVDEIPTFILKKCASEVCLPLTDITNCAFVSETCPDHFKNGIIIPLHKKGSKTDPKNFRPVTKVPSVSKVFEKILVQCIMSYLLTFNLLASEQFAYQKGKSVQQAIYAFLTFIYDSLENSENPIGIFYDLTKAFDCLDIEILISKLRDLGMCEQVLALIRSCLTNRKLCVEIACKEPNKPTNYYRSKTVTWSRGAAQGSIIGPYLFLLGMNDLPICMKQELWQLFADPSDLLTLYADDINHVIGNKKLERVVEICTAAIGITQRWTSGNNLVLNGPKLFFLQFHPPQAKVINNAVLCLGNDPISEPDCAAFLGLRINASLNWSDHVEFMSSKILKGIYVLASLRNCVSFDVLKVVYYAHVVSHLRNNIIFWGHSTEADRIFKLQKRAIRTMEKVTRRTSCAPLFKKHEMLTLPSIYILECAMFVTKNFKLFDTNRDVHQHNTRGCGDIRAIGHKKTILEKSPHYRVSHIFNKLPSDIKDIMNSTQLFKTKLKNYLLLKNFYSVHDYLKPPVKK